MIKQSSRAIPGALVLAAFVAACASPSPASLITSSPDNVSVAISAQGAKDVEGSLAAAGGIATKECAKSKKSAKLDRTETVGDGMVAHFDCVGGDASAKPTS